ncbi:related to transporter (major facilitator superfamily) [Ustilago trichophora]|uniref:Related to transporter (Major facilitator superfamily) n=1 Tax=Ustilago trichophora TaxID=86804 RepID=A0A5C3EEM7_9BASI|nr:related to transporter (major facilitator superfamily) [Ustilago trichophora]
MTETMIQKTAKAIKQSPREIFNWQIIYSVLIVAFAGVAKGIDEGNIASVVTMNSFRKEFGWTTLTKTAEANVKGWVIAIATAGAVPGAFASIKLNQMYGRLWSLRIFTLIYMAGVVGQACSNGSIGALYASRFIGGIGIGATTVMPSVYIAEIAPNCIRGLAVLQYAACQQLGVVFGFFFAYASQHHQSNNSSLQWRLCTFMQLIPAFIWLIGSLFCIESPRWLLNSGRDEQALDNLSSFRNLDASHPYIAQEFEMMQRGVLEEKHASRGASMWQLTKEVFATANSRRRFWILTAAHLFGQWSGANSITQYSPTIFSYLGITGDTTKLLATGLYGVVKFTSTVLVAFFVVDFIGRRRSLITGVIMQIITLAIVGAYLGATNGYTAAQIEASKTLTNASRLAIVAIYFHAVAWSIGWFSLPYLLSAELFETRVRGLTYGFFMAWHWLLYFGCSRATSSMLVAFNRWGAFAFFAVICVFGVSFVFLCIPDTTGRSLEEIKQIFDTPAFSIWRVAYPSPDSTVAADLDEAQVDGAAQTVSASSHSDRKSLEKEL